MYICVCVLHVTVPWYSKVCMKHVKHTRIYTYIQRNTHKYTHVYVCIFSCVFHMLLCPGTLKCVTHRSLFIQVGLFSYTWSSFICVTCKTHTNIYIHTAYHTQIYPHLYDCIFSCVFHMILCPGTLKCVTHRSLFIQVGLFCVCFTGYALNHTSTQRLQRDLHVWKGTCIYKYIYIYIYIYGEIPTHMKEDLCI